MPNQPAEWRTTLVAAILLSLTSVLLYFGLTVDLVIVTHQFVVTLPFVNVPITLHRSSSAVSVFGSVEMLWQSHHRGLAALVLAFSVLLPIIKLGCGAAICFTNLLTQRSCRALIGVLEVLGKWAILDVLAVAMLIVMTKIGDTVEVEEQAGLYWFIAAVIASKMTVLFIRRSLKPPLGEILGLSSSISRATSTSS